MLSDVMFHLKFQEYPRVSSSMLADRHHSFGKAISHWVGMSFIIPAERTISSAHVSRWGGSKPQLLLQSPDVSIQVLANPQVPPSANRGP